MATATRIAQGDAHIPAGEKLIDYEEAVEKLSELESARATIYAVNTLLIGKGVYSAEEFRFQFRQFAEKQLRRRSR